MLGAENGHRWPCPRFFTGHTHTAKCSCPPAFGTPPQEAREPQEVTSGY